MKTRYVLKILLRWLTVWFVRIDRLYNKVNRILLNLEHKTKTGDLHWIKANRDNRFYAKCNYGTVSFKVVVENENEILFFIDGVEFANTAGYRCFSDWRGYKLYTAVRGQG